MPQFRSDRILWYNNGVWGDLGYAVPNFGNDCYTLNSSVAKLVNLIGSNLFVIMQHGDTDLRRPPSINTLMRVSGLINRGRSILSSRGVPWNVQNMESTHTTPSQEVFLAYPCPYFKVRNPDLKEWAQFALTAISEAAQHSDNRQEYEISTDFAGRVGQYLQRILVRMATEFFGVPLEEAKNPTFALTDTHFKSYDPTKWFTPTEMSDTVPLFSEIPTEDDYKVLREGIPANLLVKAEPWPNLDGNVASETLAPKQALGSFAPPPGP